MFVKTVLDPNMTGDCNFFYERIFRIDEREEIDLGYSISGIRRRAALKSDGGTILDDCGGPIFYC